MSEPLSREEFVGYMELFKEMVDNGFTGIQQRQDIANGRTGKLEDRVTGLEKPDGATDLKAKLGAAAGVGAGLVGGLVGAAKALGWL
jgi:hypothetical protein